MYKNLAKVRISRSKVKVLRDKKTKNCMVSRGCRPNAARRSGRLHCVAAGGDGVTAVHADGDLLAVLSGAVLAVAATSVGKSAHAVKFLRLATKSVSK